MFLKTCEQKKEKLYFLKKQACTVYKNKTKHHTTQNTTTKKNKTKNHAPGIMRQDGLIGFTQIPMTFPSGTIFI